jgi:hypothetical protein
MSATWGRTIGASAGTTVFSLKPLQATILGSLIIGSFSAEGLRTSEIASLRLQGGRAETEITGAKPSVIPPSARETLFNLRDELRLIQLTLPAPDARRIAQVALSDVNFMIRGWTPGCKIPAEYSSSLEKSLQLLDLVLKSKEEGHSFSALQSAADDLHIKAEHFRKSGGGLGEMVTVLVHTRKDDREQRNLQVFYLPKMMEAVQGAQPDQFPELSSPTSHSLPPGRYLMWAREPQSNMIGTRTSVSIGDGNKTVEWTLPVP